MPTAANECPKCNGPMVQGFVLDYTGGVARIVSHWAAGVPRDSSWGTGPKLPEQVIPIGTFRCSSCGYLESYAMPEFEAQ